MKLEIKRLDKELPLPSRAHPGDAGLDLYASDCWYLRPGERGLIATGVAIKLPPNMAGLVVPRSGLAYEKGITVLNSPGVIDFGYRGEILVNVINLGYDPVDIERGDRIAQLLLQHVWNPDIVEVEELDETARGTAGHGSTGK